MRKLDIEGSFRHDAYHGTLAGSTSNPKVAFTWLVDEMVGATIRGSWGTSFRFANAGEYSTIASDPAGAEGLPGDAAVARINCTSGVADCRQHRCRPVRRRLCMRVGSGRPNMGWRSTSGVAQFHKRFDRAARYA